MKEVVFFDLDGTIINGQSQQIFLNYALKNKIIGVFFYLRIFFWFVLYKLGLVKNPRKVMDFAFSFLAGWEEKKVKGIAKTFFDKDLKKFIFAEIIDIINKHKSLNREIVIISNAANIFSENVTEFLEIKNCISTKLEVESGKFTGKILGDIVYGKNKAFLAREFIKNNSLDLAGSFAYTDHISDLDLLLVAENPYAVNPDRWLLKEAKKRKWPIINFKK